MFYCRTTPGHFLGLDHHNLFFKNPKLQNAFRCRMFCTHWIVCISQPAVYLDFLQLLKVVLKDQAILFESSKLDHFEQFYATFLFIPIDIVPVILPYHPRRMRIHMQSVQTPESLNCAEYRNPASLRPSFEPREH